jgi:hypothetical protein
MPRFDPTAPFAERSVTYDLNVLPPHCSMADATDRDVLAPLRLVYDPVADPHSAAMILDYNTDTPLPRMVARDLLIAGLVSEQCGSGYIGTGEVAFRRARDTTRHPTADVLWIRLPAGDEYVYCWTPILVPARFVRDSLALVSLGDEQQYVPNDAAALTDPPEECPF